MIVFYKGYSPPKCSCNGKHTHSSEFTIPTRMSTCPIPMPRVLTYSLTHAYAMYENRFQTKIFVLIMATLRYKYVGQTSEVNLLGNSPKKFIGLSDVNCWTISQHNSSDNFLINFYLNKYTKKKNHCLDNPSILFVMHSHLLF